MARILENDFGRRNIKVSTDDIISIKETDELYSFPDVKINDLAAEVIADIENNLDDWESFYCTNEGAQELKDRIQILKNYLSEEE